MMGHGTRNNFRFTKQRRNLSAQALRNLLRAAADECCCKIHVVIFSCHSGSFLDELFEDPHVISAYTSCQDNERSYTDAWWENGSFRDRGDWMDGFNKDWAEVPRGTSLGDALEIASRTAEQRMSSHFTPTQHPQGWRRGAQRVVAHVERVQRRRRRVYRLQIHFYEPEFVRCTRKWVNVGPHEVPQNIEDCNWITFTGDFQRPRDDVGVGERDRINRSSHREGIGTRAAGFPKTESSHNSYGQAKMVVL